jgi:hypothetical protein
MAKANEFIMEISAPTYYGWTGCVLGDSMSKNLMLVTWTDGDKVVISPRMAE